MATKLTPSPLDDAQARPRPPMPGADDSEQTKLYSGQHSRFRYTRREEEGAARAVRMQGLPSGINTPYKDIQGGVTGSMSRGTKDIMGNVTGRYSGQTGAGASPFEAVEGSIGGASQMIGGVKSLRSSVQEGSFGSLGGKSLMDDPGRQSGAISIGKSFGMVGGADGKLRDMATPIFTGPGNKKEDRTFLTEGQTGVGSWASQTEDEGGEVRTFASKLDDHVFNGDMSDKDRMQVMRAMNRKYGAKGVLV